MATIELIMDNYDLIKQLVSLYDRSYPNRLNVLLSYVLLILTRIKTTKSLVGEKALKDQELEFDDGLFTFETVMRIRNTEIDIGQHLRLESLTELLTEAQMRFLYSKGIKEITADRQGLTVTNLQLAIISRARAREDILFEVGLEQITDNDADIAIKVTRMYDGTLVAKARMHLSLYDYRLNKTIALNKNIKDALNQ